MKRLLPLLFLVPSLALLIYARRDAKEEAPKHFEVPVRVDTGGFEFPDDVPVWVSVIPAEASGDEVDVREQVTAGRATLRLPKAGIVVLGLHVFPSMEGKAGVSAVPVGKPQEFELRTEGDVPSWNLVVTPDECRAALAALRKPG